MGYLWFVFILKFMFINCKGRLIDLSSPKIMGAINLNTSSFFAGSRVESDDALLKKTKLMLDEGADFIDLGFMSSKPGAAISEPDEEAQIITKAVSLIIKNFPDALISIDTLHASVAEASLKEGAAMINDISGGLYDPNMIPMVATFHVPYVVMHMKGTPQTMQNLTNYDDLLLDIIKVLAAQMKKAREAGIIDLLVDPGFGFGKSIEQNFELLSKLDLFKMLEAPILVGLSRKSMIYKTLGISAEDALNGTTALNTIALMKGASMLRVHDVKPAKECVNLFLKIKEFN